MNIDIFIVGVFLLITLFIGFWRGKKNKTIADYAVADRDFPTVALVATIVATFIGSGTTLGVIEKIHSAGIVFIFINMGVIIQKLLIIKTLSHKRESLNGCLSCGDIIHKFYNRNAKILTGIIIFLYCSVILGMQFKALGTIFEYYLGISGVDGILIGAAIVILYSAFGGIRAVIVTDVFQFAVLIAGFTIICNASLGKIGGYQSLFDSVPSSHFNFLDWDNIFKYVLPVIAFQIIPFNPTTAQRYLIAKDLRQVKQSISRSLLVELVLFTVIGLIGLITIALYPDMESKLVLPHLVNSILPVGFKGLVICGFISVMMSTADSFLNSGSVAMVNDVIKETFPKTQKYDMVLLKIFATSIGFIGIYVALSKSTIVDIRSSLTSIWTTTILLPMFLSMIGYHVSKTGFFVTVFSGLSSYFIWKFCGFEASTGINSMLIGLGVNFAIYMIFLYLRRYPRFAAKVLPPAARMVSSEDFKKKPSKFNLGFLCSLIRNPGLIVKSRVNKIIADQEFNLKLNIDSRQYKTLGIINLMLYFMPFTLILDDISSSSQAVHIMLVKIATVFFGVVLLLHELYPNKIKRILPFCWYMVLMFNMSAVPCYFLFISDATVSSLAVFGLSSLVLLVILQWYEFVIVSIFGLVVGFLACTFLKQHQFYFILPNIYYYEFINIYIFLSVACYILIRNKEYLRIATTARLKTEVSKKTAYLMEALEIKQRILNNISHEIRTPLQGVMSLSSLTYDLWPKLSEAERKSYLQKIITNGDRLMSLVSNLLDISKLDSSSMIFNKDCNNLVTIINEVIGEFDGVYQDCKINLDISNFSAYDKLRLFDYHRISQVIRNLLSNAYKYGDKQTVILLELRDYVYKYNDSEILGVKFSVINKGIGIPEAELKSIFEAFTESSRTRKGSGGTGLGLTICKEIIENHDGLIYAKNRADGYTEIGFTLPQFSDSEYEEYIADKNILDAAIDESRIRAKASKGVILKEPEQELDQDQNQDQDQDQNQAKELSSAANTRQTKESLKQTQNEILSDKSKPKVLIIDDEDIVLSSCSLIMRSLGFKIYTANGGLSALEQLGISESNQQQESGMEEAGPSSTTQTQQTHVGSEVTASLITNPQDNQEKVLGLGSESKMEKTGESSTTTPQQPTPGLETEPRQSQMISEAMQAKQSTSKLEPLSEIAQNTDLSSSTMPLTKKSASHTLKATASELKHHKFDLILLDLMMPDIYGAEVLKQIRANDNTRDIPVIVQSGIADDNEITKIYKIGANHFIAKPYGKDKIKQALNKIKFWG